jgi:pyoverdine/dityrosine biosynthesis protein Dit1
MRKKYIKSVLLNYTGNHRRNILSASLDKFVANVGIHLEEFSPGQDFNLILPGFPYKSVSHKKTMGVLPDLGEVKALETLSCLVNEISDVIDRRCRIIICSDGFAFNDLKGVTDKNVILYRESLKQMIHLKSDIDVIGLDDLLPNKSIKEKRITLRDKYLQDLDMVHFYCESEMLRDLHHNLFIFAQHDLLKKEYESKKEFKQRCREVAFEVMCRSYAWSTLIENAYPKSLRHFINKVIKIINLSKIFINRGITNIRYVIKF